MSINLKSAFPSSLTMTRSAAASSLWWNPCPPHGSTAPAGRPRPECSSRFSWVDLELLECRKGRLGVWFAGAGLEETRLRELQMGDALKAIPFGHPILIAL